MREMSTRSNTNAAHTNKYNGGTLLSQSQVLILSRKQNSQNKHYYNEQLQIENKTIRISKFVKQQSKK